MHPRNKDEQRKPESGLPQSHSGEVFVEYRYVLILVQIYAPRGPFTENKYKKKKESSHKWEWEKLNRPRTVLTLG